MNVVKISNGFYRVEINDKIYTIERSTRFRSTWYIFRLLNNHDLKHFIDVNNTLKNCKGQIFEIEVRGGNI